MICQGLVLLLLLFNLFILCCVLWYFWISLVSDIISGKFLVIIVSTMSSFPFSLFSDYVYVIPFYSYTIVLRYSVMVFQSLSPLLFSFVVFYWDILMLRDFPLSHVQSTNRPTKGIHFFYTFFLISKIYFWFFLRTFISVLISPIFSCMLFPYLSEPSAFLF